MSKKQGSTAQIVETLARPIAEGLGLELWDVSYGKEGTGWILRLLIDKEGGVTIEDCEKMSRAVDGPLDELDPIEGSYSLEVSSPGLERDLKRREHFEKCIGRPAVVKLYKALPNGSKESKGILEALRDDDVVVLSAEDGTREFNRKDCARVYLDDFDFGGYDNE